MFCHSCGAELTPGAKFCTHCGAKIDLAVPSPSVEEREVDEITQGLADEFRSIIADRVIAAYGTQGEVDKDALYRDAETYRADRKMVDDEVGYWQERLELFHGYLTKKVLKEDLLLSVTETLTNEALNYAAAIGLDEGDAQIVFDRFIESNEIYEKHDYLIKLLEGYGTDGQWHIKELSDKAGSGWDALVRRLVEAVGKLEAEGIRLHDQSGSPVLSSQEQRKLSAQGKRLGFHDEEYISIAVTGNEIKCGYAARADREAAQKRKAAEENSLSEAVPRKSTILFGVRIEFPGSYFIERYTYDHFAGKFSALGKEAEDELAQCDINDQHIAETISAVVVDAGYKSLEYIDQYAQEVGLKEEEQSVVYDTYRYAVDTIGDRLQELGTLFAQIDQGVDGVALQGEIRKAMRGRVQAIGIGAQGLVGAALTQSVVNAGTGLAYDLMNGFKQGHARMKASEQKKAVLDGCIKVARDFYNDSEKAVPQLILQAIQEYRPYAVWIRDETQIRELTEALDTTQDEKTKQETLVQLLVEDPWEAKYYENVLELIQRESIQAQGLDGAHLCGIAGWFEQDADGYREKYMTAAMDTIEQSYGVSDMARYDALMKLEHDAGYTDCPRHNSICGQYVSDYISHLPDFSAKTVSAAKDELSAFCKKYDHDFENAKQSLRQALLVANGIVLETDGGSYQDVVTIRSNISIAQKLVESYDLGLEEWIAQQNAALTEIIERLVHVEEIVSYNIGAKEFGLSERDLDAPEEVAQFQAAMEELHSLCEQLQLDGSADSVLEKIEAICDKSGYGDALRQDLKKQFVDNDLAQRTVYGIVYDTMAEADAARKEYEKMKAVLGKGKYGKEELAAFDMFLQMDIRTPSGKKLLDEQERSILREYGQKKESVSAAVAGGGAKIGGALILAILGTAVGAACVYLFGMIMKIVGVCICIAGWVKLGDTIRYSRMDVKDRSEMNRQNDAFRSEFDRRFLISDGHIRRRSDVESST